MKYKKRLQRISKAIDTLIKDIVEEEQLISHLYKSKIIDDYEGNLIIVDPYELNLNHDENISNKDLRLLKEIILQQYPVYKNMPDIISDILEKDFNLDVSKSKIKELKSFKKITKKSIIYYDNKKNKPYVKQNIRFKNKNQRT